MTTSAATRQVGSVMLVDISGKLVLGEDLASLRNLVSNLVKKGTFQSSFDKQFVSSLTCLSDPT